MLSIKGNTIIKDISLLNSLINIKPKDINIKIYNIGYTVPNRQEGGDHLVYLILNTTVYYPYVKYILNIYPLHTYKF